MVSVGVYTCYPVEMWMNKSLTLVGFGYRDDDDDEFFLGWCVWNNETHSHPTDCHHYFWINICILIKWKVNILHRIWLFTLENKNKKLSYYSIIDKLKNMRKRWIIQ